MTKPTTAAEAWPLVSNLSTKEQGRLASMLLAAKTDAERYAALPPGPDEFRSEPTPLARETYGWDEFRHIGADI